jgi:uracil-DNA glycosylase
MKKMSDPPVQVLGYGPKPCKVMIIGEAPGAEEVTHKRPFVGASGSLLTSMCVAAGLNREECYVTNVVKVQPPANDIDRLHEIGRTISEYIPMLEMEIRECAPNVILALGNTPLTP